MKISKSTYSLCLLVICMYLSGISKVSAQFFTAKKMKVYTDLQEAENIAQINHKPLFIYSGRLGCGSSSLTWMNIRNDKALKKKLNEDVVFVYVDPDGKDWSRVFSILSIEAQEVGLPLMGIVNVSTKNVYVSSMGYQEVSFVYDMLKKANR